MTDIDTEAGLNRDELMRHSKTSLVGAILAQAPHVRLLQQEWAKAEAENAKLRAAVSGALALIREIRPDRIVDTSPEVRLGLIGQVLGSVEGEADRAQG